MIVEWIEYGYDVCDVNGFFSILHMDILEISQTKLFQSNTLFDAYLLSNKANILVPDHSPFMVVKLKIYKNNKSLNNMVYRQEKALICQT